MNARQVAVEAVEAADEFFSRRLWQRLANEQIVGIELAGRPPIVAGVMGAARQEFGLHLLVGELAIEEMLAMGRGELDHFGLHSQSLSFSLTRRIDIAPPFDRALVDARRQGRMVPLFLCMERGHTARPPRKQEYETLILTARALLVADAAGRLEPGDPEESGRLLTLQVSGTLRQPDVAITLQSIAPRRAVTVPAGGVAAPPDLAGLPVRKAHYCVALPSLPMTVGGESELTRVVIVLDTTHDKIATISIVEDNQVAEARDHVFAMLRGGGKSVPAGLPEKMVVADQELYRELEPSLRALGIDCVFQRDVPELTEVIESLGEHLKATAHPEAESGSAPEPSSPDDLDAWKAVDMAVTNLLAGAGIQAAMTNDKTWRRYLGVDRAERDSLLKDLDVSLVTGYLDWYLHHHRATKRSRTVAERVLASDLSPPVRSTLLARQSARHSFYRVGSVKVGEGVELCDLLADTRCFVSDRSISMTAKEGSVFPARIYSAGAFSFAMPVGPLMSGLTASEGLDFLEVEHGLQLDGAVDPAAAHLLGRLWPWIADRVERGISLQNRDGHPLSWHAAQFSVSDSKSLSMALEARADIEVIEPGCEWTWCRDDWHLGRLELFGGEELVLEVNSAERYLEARRWLEAMAGVTFESVVQQEFDPRQVGRPLDDRLPRLGSIDANEIPPREALEIMQRMTDENCMRWLDESIPMLGGKSPRQTCRTAAGRRKITQLIRTYPDPMGVPGVRVPREHMLAELGLGEADSGEAIQG